MSAAIVLITGANTGIGFQIVRALSSSTKPCHILVGAQSLTKARDAIEVAREEYPSSPSTYTPIVINIEADKSIQSAFNQASYTLGGLGVLINNAGAQLEPQYSRGEISERELWNRSWSVNIASIQVVTSTFVPLLLKSTDPQPLFVTPGTSMPEGTR
ncbi:hypothetical protein BJX63DRAFT_436744 [Aspergillus granulosus]|uniref:Uncharacterized protein n=1 Tax=Aspergillus granulosus TaxID=176169 RepID=A0ABR4GX18_9EURO